MSQFFLFILADRGLLEIFVGGIGSVGMRGLSVFCEQHYPFSDEWIVGESVVFGGKIVPRGSIKIFGDT